MVDRLFQAAVSEPSDETVIWRYLSFGRFVALLAQQALYFVRPHAFSDPFEAAIGPAERREEYLEGSRSMFREVLQEGRKSGAVPREVSIEEEAGRLTQEWINLNRTLPLNTYISCWHESPHESEAMWRLYAKDTTEGISIQSTCGRLRRSLPALPLFCVGRVTYVDYENGPVHPLFRFFKKRQSFEHEREVRAVFVALDETPPEEPGKLIPTDLGVLIQGIVISPYAPAWVEAVARSVALRFGIAVPIGKSALLATAFRF